jgi:hypothetical protein
VSEIDGEVFALFSEIGEVASLMHDVAAREISENKPIPGTSIAMLARMIEAIVERGMESTDARHSIAHTAAAPVVEIPDRLRPCEVSPDAIANVRDDLHGLGLLASCLSELGAGGTQIEPQAVDSLGDLARRARDRLTEALTQAEARR